jgi:hypothetical protein
LTSNLNGAQFGDAVDIEEQQRRRFRRKQESGYVGNGYNFTNYPYMVGALGAGTITQTQNHEAGETPMQETAEHDAGTDVGETVAGTTGMGDGGTAASATGASGGGMP